MKNITPLLEDVMRVLYTLQNEGYRKLECYLLDKTSSNAYLNL